MTQAFLNTALLKRSLNHTGAPILKLVLTGAGLAIGMVAPVYGDTTNPSTTVTIDAGANIHAISPLIYGVNGIDYGIGSSTSQLAGIKAPVVRMGGDSTSRYNWQINADNRANDYYYESIADDSSVPGERADTFIGNAQPAGAAQMVTIPMQSYIAKLGANRSILWSYSIAKYGAQTGSDPYQPDAGTGISASTGAFINNDPTDANVPNTTTIQQAWIQHIVSKWGTAANGGLKYYILDNEPGFWDSTHRDVHPVGTHASEYLNDFLTYSALVKGVDSTALVVGPEESDWYTYFYTGYDLQYAAAHNYNGVDPDRQNVQGGLDYLPWLLQQIAAHDQTAGSRSLDVFSVHYYPQGPEYSDDTSQSTQLLRNQSTRELWDPSYHSQNVQVLATGNPGAVVDLIPLLKTWVSSYYPSTKIGITEYSWGADAYIGGATAQADVLGILGREGVDLATRWIQPDPSTPTYLAFKLYRNYDGAGSSFGDSSVSDMVVNPDNLSSFAATRTSDGALTVIIDNKVLSGSTPVTINLANFNAGSVAQVWQLTSANSIEQLTTVAVASNSLTTTVPAQSITLLVIPPQASTLNFAQWLAFYHVTGTGTATPKNDGVPNLLKYLDNIDPSRPMTAADRAALPTGSLTKTNGSQYLTLTYRQYKSATGLTVAVQTSTDLSTWSNDTNAADQPQATGTVDGTTGDPFMKVQIPVTGAQLFVRLNVTSQ
jgi:Glycoside hydrolase family 44